MKFEKMPFAEARKNDKPAMVNAIQKLQELDIDVRRPNSYQLKVTDHISYYPSKQTIFIDEEESVRPERGFAALLDLLVEWGHLSADALERQPYDIKLNC